MTSELQAEQMAFACAQDRLDLPCGRFSMISRVMPSPWRLRACPERSEGPGLNGAKHPVPVGLAGLPAVSGAQCRELEHWQRPRARVRRE